jgi:hypothetical protein
MTQTDRSEVREMIKGILSGWHDSTVEREKLIYLSLNNIDSHLEKLNGKVSSHEKTILENLPHSIAHCPQTQTIKEIHDAMVENVTTKKVNEISWGKVITYGTFLIGMFMAWLGYKALMVEAKATKSEVEVTNDILHSPTMRGNQYIPPIFRDSIK